MAEAGSPAGGPADAPAISPDLAAVVVDVAHSLDAPLRDPAGRDWVGLAGRALSSLGPGAGADRAYVFEVVERTADEVVVTQREEWCAPGIASQMDNSLLLRFPVRGQGMDPVFTELSAGRDVVLDDLGGLDAGPREILESQQIASMVLVPVRPPDEPVRGFLGLDVCDEPRPWDPRVVAGLRAVADLLAVRASWDLRRQSVVAADVVTTRAVAREADLAERLQVLDDLRDRILGSLNHAVRTPLAVLRMTGEALARTPLAEDPEAVRTLAASIERQTVRLEELLGELLDLRTAVADVGEDDYEALRLVELVDGALASLARPVDGPEVEVDVTGQLVVHGDRRLLARALHHLLDNAVQHGTGATRIVVRGRAEEDRVVVDVVDDGPGIPASWRPFMADPFSAPVNGRDHAPRLGVGLALVRHVAQLHAGRFSLHDAGGGGTHARLVLPAAEPV